jgi:hypothetical protein
VSLMPPSAPRVAVMPHPVDLGEPLSVGILHYHTAADLAVHLRTLRQFTAGRLVVVLGYHGPLPAAPAFATPTVRVIATSDEPGAEPDPFRASVLAVTGLRPSEGLVFLFPVDWAGPSPEYLAEQGRRWRAGPTEPEAGEVYPIDDPN